MARVSLNKTISAAGKAASKNKVTAKTTVYGEVNETATLRTEVSTSTTKTYEPPVTVVAKPLITSKNTYWLTELG